MQKYSSNRTICDYVKNYLAKLGKRDNKMIQLIKRKLIEQFKWQRIINYTLFKKRAEIEKSVNKDTIDKILCVIKCLSGEKLGRFWTFHKIQ